MTWHHTRLTALALTFGLALTACGDSRDVDIDIDDNDFSDAEVTLAEGDEFAVLTENGAVKLGLTRERVYFQLSEAVREHVDSAMAVDLDASDSRLARAIGRAVRRGVQSALRFDVDFDIDDMDLDDEPIGRAFREEDARAFVDAFRRVKGMGPASDATPDTSSSSTDTSAEVDTSGGASF